MLLKLEMEEKGYYTKEVMRLIESDYLNMKCRKIARLVFSIFVILLVLLVNSPAYAHGGRTDGAGGHYNHSTGMYHYHHGYTAHQHIDGKCPYDDNSETKFDRPDSEHSNINNNAIEDENSKSTITESLEKISNNTITFGKIIKSLFAGCLGCVGLTQVSFLLSSFFVKSKSGCFAYMIPAIVGGVIVFIYTLLN